MSGTGLRDYSVQHDGICMQESIEPTRVTGLLIYISSLASSIDHRGTPVLGTLRLEYFSQSRQTIAFAAREIELNRLVITERAS